MEKSVKKIPTEVATYVVFACRFAVWSSFKNFIGPEAYSELWQISKMELFAKIVNGLQSYSNSFGPISYACIRPQLQRLKVQSIIGRKYSIDEWKENPTAHHFLYIDAMKSNFCRLLIYVAMFA